MSAAPDNFNQSLGLEPEHDLAFVHVNHPAVPAIVLLGIKNGFIQPISEDVFRPEIGLVKPAGMDIAIGFDVDVKIAGHAGRFPRLLDRRKA